MRGGTDEAMAEDFGFFSFSSSFAFVFSFSLLSSGSTVFTGGGGREAGSVEDGSVLSRARNFADSPRMERFLVDFLMALRERHTEVVFGIIRPRGTSSARRWRNEAMKTGE